MEHSSFGHKHGPAPQRDVFDIDLRALWATVRKHRLALILIIVAALMASVAVTLLMKPKYRAAATVQIEQQSARVLSAQQLTPEPTAQESERFLQTQIGVIRSRSIAQAVMNELRLANDPRAQRTLGLDGDYQAAGALSADEVKREAILGALSDNLNVKLPPDSRLATINFLSTDPVLAAKIANSYATNYIDANLRGRFETSSYARQFLAEQLGQARERLERSEREALAYARQARLINTSTPDRNQPGGAINQSLTTATLARLNQSHADTLAARLLAEQRWQQAQGANFMTLPEVVANPAIQDLIGRRAELEAERGQALKVRTAEYPNMERYAAQIAEIDQQIDTLGASIRATLKSQFDVAARQEQAIASQLARLQGETLSERDRNVQLSILERAVDTNRGLYDALLQRYRELSAEAGIQQNTITILDRADVPSKPVSPILLLNLALALGAGLVLGALYILVRENMDDRINTGAEVEEKLGLPLLGAIPTAASADSVAEEIADPRSDMSEAYNAVRTLLRLSSTQGLPRSLLITSAQPGEGKTTTASALARALARMGKSVVVADLDLRRPSLQKSFGTAFQRGAVDYLTNAASIEDVIRPTGVENIAIIPSGPMPPSPTELLSGATLTRMLGELTQRFDIVIVDAPPTIGLADALILGDAVEATLLVVVAGRNQQGNLKGTVARLRQSGSKIIGVVLTQYDSKDFGYAYDYNYSYKYEPANA